MMSVKLQVLYRHPVPVETPLRVVGRILRLRGRLGKAEGQIILPDGTLACEAQMSLADVPKELLASTHPSLLNWKVD
jgi:acyl-CoA thioesterase FadM